MNHSKTPGNQPATLPVARISWVDNAKAIGIILVVLGHTKGLADGLEQLIYTFHMPLFFFISGFLVKDTQLSLPFRSFTSMTTRRLIYPYVVFWFITYSYWLAVHYLMGGSLQLSEVSNSPFHPFIGLLVGTGKTLYINPALWFFTCLVSTTILFYWVSKLKAIRLILLLLVISAFLGPAVHNLITIRLPWNLELALVAMVFYGLGYIFPRAGVSGTFIFSKARFLPIVLLCVILFFVVASNGKVNMNKMQFGNPALFYLGALAGISLTIILSHIIPQNRLCEWISRNTLIIFALHLPIFSVFKGIGVIVFKLNYSFQENPIASVLYTIGVFPITYLISYILSNYIPFLLGQRYQPLPPERMVK